MDRSDSKYVVLGVPLDQTYTYRSGCKYAPDSIRKSSCELELYSYMSSLSLEHLGFNDLGNVVMPPGDLRRSFENVERVFAGLREEIDSKSKVYVLGGEHLITYSILRTMSREVEQLIVFDAHLDLRSSYLESTYNHATVMRRIFEEFRLPIVYYGSRAFSSEEIDFANSNRDLIQVCTPKSIYRSECKTSSYDRVYVSIDMDVLDPAYAPGVSNPEPFGIAPMQLVKCLYRVIEKSREVQFIDLVEVNPLYDNSDNTSMYASKILLELTGFFERTAR